MKGTGGMHQAVDERSGVAVGGVHPDTVLHGEPFEGWRSRVAEALFGRDPQRLAEFEREVVTNTFISYATDPNHAEMEPEEALAGFKDRYGDRWSNWPSDAELLDELDRCLYPPFVIPARVVRTREGA